MPARKTQIVAKSSKCTKPGRLFVSEHLEILSFDDFPGVRENRLSRLWACGAVGSALPWHGRGRRFDPDQVHHFNPPRISHFKRNHPAGLPTVGESAVNRLLIRKTCLDLLENCAPTLRIDCGANRRKAISFPGFGSSCD